MSSRRARTTSIGRRTPFDLQSQDLRLLSLVLPGGQHVRGNVQKLAAAGRGSVSSPEGTVDLDVDALETDASQLGRVTVNAVAKNNEATITASADRFNLDANALVGLMRPWPTTLKVRADNLDLAALPVQASPESEAMQLSGLQGQLRATIDASGNLTEPEKGQSHGRARVARRHLERPPVHGDEPVARFGTPTNGWRSRSSKSTASDASLTVTGDLPLTDAGRRRRDRRQPARQSRDGRAVPAAGDEHRGRRRGRLDRIAARHAQAHRAGPDADGRQRAHPLTHARARLLEHRPPRAHRERRGGHRATERRTGARQRSRPRAAFRSRCCPSCPSRSRA